MKTKEVLPYSEVRDRILRGVDKVTEPVAQTLTPKGKNVIFETDEGQYAFSNDGITIAEKIILEDPVENAAADIVKKSAIRTNQVAGDGTTSTMILTRNLIKEGFKLIDNGWNQMELKRVLDRVSTIVSEEISNQSKKATTKKQLFAIAKVSANNDAKIAEDVVSAIESAGENGLILIENNQNETVEVKKDLGFLIEQGMFSKSFVNQPDNFSARYDNVKVFITDKRIYYESEVLAILTPLAKEGIKDVVVIARDFIGNAPNIFLANHLQKRMNILLVKDPDATDSDISSLEDLADYLGCKVFTDKAGKLTTEDITIDDFGTADKVLSIGEKTLVLKDKSIERMEKIAKLKDALKSVESEKEQKEIEKRLSRMTSGTVTIKIGGNTPAEAREKAYRYEDSVSATRIAQQYGYLEGGGVTLHKVCKNLSETLLNEFDDDLVRAVERVCNSPLKQIAENCNIHYPELLKNVDEGLGYNAATDKYCNLMKEGIIEPTKVLQLAFENAVSAAGTILSSNYLILIKKEDEEEQK